MKFKIIIAICALLCVPAFADSDTPPAWPLIGSEADYYSQNKTLNFGGHAAQDMNNAPTDGWSGGASLTPPDNFLINGEEDSVMKLSNVKLIENNGYQTLSGSNAPVAPMISEQEVYTINEYGVSQMEGEKEYRPDMIREWVAKDGKTVREIIEEWATLEGWEIVWSTNREYPLKASAIFKGRFTDVASALVRSFGRASPPPYAKFYFGNKVLVVKTLEDENAD